MQPDVTKVGGISEERRIAWMAEENGVRFIPHGWNTALGLAADLHLASASRKTDLVEYLTGSPFIDDLVADTVEAGRRRHAGHPEQPRIGSASSTWTRWKSIRASAFTRRERVTDMATPAKLVHDLPRRLGMLDATAIVVGIVIGSGIFVLPNVIARSVPSYAGIVAAWVIGGVLSFFGALAYAELGAMLPATGGQYVYLREAYGPMCAFVCGWTFMLAVLAGGSAWLAVTFSIYAGYFVPLTPVAAKALAVALIAVLSAVNYVGVKEGAWVQRTFTCLKVVALVILIGAAFVSRDTGPPPPCRPRQVSRVRPFRRGHGGMPDGVQRLELCQLRCRGGAGSASENLLRSLVIGMAAVAVLYVSANLAYLKVMTIAADRRDRARRRGCGDADHGLDRRDVRIAGGAAFDYRRDQRLHSDGGADPVRAGPGRAVLRTIRRSASAISDARLRHRVRGNLDGRFSWSRDRTRRCTRTRSWPRGSSIR